MRRRDRKAKGADNLILFIVGRKGSGKSTLVRDIARAYGRVFIIDTMEEYGEEDGFEEVRGFDACAARVREVAAEGKNFRLSLRVETPDDAMDLVPIIYTVHLCLFVLEEAAWYTSPSYLPDELGKMVRTGRHPEIDQIYVTQRPAAVSRDLSAAADIVVTFQAHEPRDIAYFRALGGKEFAEQVAELPRFKVLARGQVERAPLAVLERLDTAAEK